MLHISCLNTYGEHKGKISDKLSKIIEKKIKKLTGEAYENG